MDVKSVKWLEDYLISRKNVTCLIVSHDSGYVRHFFIRKDEFVEWKRRFLDNVTTDIIHYETKKV